MIWTGLKPRGVPADAPLSKPPSAERLWRRHVVKVLGRRQALKFIKSERRMQAIERGEISAYH